MLSLIEINLQEIEVHKVLLLIYLITIRTIGMLYLMSLCFQMVLNQSEEELIIFNENLFIGLIELEVKHC